jgi:hypothetical protein
MKYQGVQLILIIIQFKIRILIPQIYIIDLLSLPKNLI